MTRAGELARTAGSTETRKRPRGQTCQVLAESSYVHEPPKSGAQPSHLENRPADQIRCGSAGDNGDENRVLVAIPARKRVASLDTGALTQRGGPGDRHNSASKQSREVTSTPERMAARCPVCNGAAWWFGYRHHAMCPHRGRR